MRFAVLRKERIRKVLRLSRGLFIVCLSIMVGCQLIVDTFRSGRELSSFPHELHVAQEEMECLDCHEPSGDDMEPSYPDYDYCADCHDPEKEQTLLARFFVDKEPRWVHSGRQDHER